MEKNEKTYKIFMSIMLAATAIMLLITGIIAIQKQLKLNVEFKCFPNINTEIYVSSSEKSETLMFRNFADDKEEGYCNSSYCSLSADKLTMTPQFIQDFGASFAVEIWNYTGFTITAELITNTTTLINGQNVQSSGVTITPNKSCIADSDSEKFEVLCMSSMRQNETIEIKLTELKSVNVVYNLTNCSVENRETMEREVQYGETYVSTITPAEGYILPYHISVDNAQGAYSWDAATGAFQISDWSRVVGDIIITCSGATGVYTATFDGNGGVDGVSIVTTDGTPLGVLPISIREDYVFKGWFTAESGGEKVTEASLMPSENVTYYAQWKAATYIVNYHPNGGSGAMVSEVWEYGVERQLTANTFSKENCSFSDWLVLKKVGKTYTPLSYADQENVVDIAGEEGIVTLYAQWGPNTNVSVTVNDQVFVQYSSPTVFPNNINNSYYVYYTNMGQYTEDNETFYDVEWVVLGGSLETNYQGGTQTKDYIPNETLFLSSNYGTEWTADSSGFYIGGEKAKSLLLFSRYKLGTSSFESNWDLMKAMYNPEDGTSTLGLTDIQKSKILETNLAKTDRGIFDQEVYDLKARFFPLGQTTGLWYKYDSSEWDPLDSFDVIKYFQFADGYGYYQYADSSYERLYSRSYFPLITYKSLSFEEYLEEGVSGDYPFNYRSHARSFVGTDGRYRTALFALFGHYPLNEGRPSELGVQPAVCFSLE